MHRHGGWISLALIVGCLIVPTVAHRIWLSFNPYTNFDPFGYNVPHLFTGVLLIMFGGLPMTVCRLGQRLHLLAAMVFAVGLSLALDEWVYLIATNGSDDEYLLPVSWAGSVVMITIAGSYAVLWWVFGRSRK